MTYKIFLPLIKRELPCEEVFYDLLRKAPGQERLNLTWDRCLADAACIRAAQASEEWAHSYKGISVNEIVRRYCPLPADYPQVGNSLESLVGGLQDPAKALESLLRSPAHRKHLLGTTPFFREQTRCGIGYFRKSSTQFQFYYAIIISK